MTRLKIDPQFYLNPKMQPLAGSTLTNIFRLLAWNRFHVNWKFIPKLLYVLTLSALFLPIRLCERARYDKKIKDMKIPEVLCIIGHFRSGTTFLHYLMGQDRNLSFVSTRETMAPAMMLTLDRFIENIVKEHLPSKRPMDDLEMDARLPYEDEYALANLSPYSFYHGWYFPRNIYHYFRKYVLFDNVSEEIKEEWKEVYRYMIKKISFKYGNKPVLLKSPVNTGRIKLLLDTFPDIKFIHIYRNPYHVYLSTWRLYRSIIPIFSFQEVDVEFIDRLIIDFYKEVYKRYLEEKRYLDENNLIEFKYEEFVKDPLSHLKNIYSRFNLNWFDEAKTRFERYLYKHRNYQAHQYVVDDELRKKIGKEWEFAFKEFGYEI